MRWVRFHLYDRHNETFFIHADHPHVAKRKQQKEEAERQLAEFESQKRLIELKAH